MNASEREAGSASGCGGARAGWRARVGAFVRGAVAASGSRNRGCESASVNAETTGFTADATNGNPQASQPQRAEGKAVTLTFITRANCSLCDSAHTVVQEVLEAAAGRIHICYEEKNVDEDLSLIKYSEYVPVVLINGKQHAAFRVNEEQLARAILAAARTA